jgi:hypothetical protein
MDQGLPRPEPELASRHDSWQELMDDWEQHDAYRAETNGRPFLGYCFPSGLAL